MTTRDPTGLGALKVLAATAIAAVVVLLVSLPLLATRIDAQAREHETHLVRNGLAQLQQVLTNRQGSTANWNDLLRHSDETFDAAWLTDGLGDPSGKDVGSRLVAVVDYRGKIAFAMHHNVPVAAFERRALQTATGELVRRLWAGEAARDQELRHPPPVTDKDWVQETADVVLDGVAYQMVGDVIGSDNGKLTRTHAHAPILLYASSYPMDILPALARHLALQDARVETGAAEPYRGAGQILLRGLDGSPVGALSWTPQRPGARLLQDAAAPLIGSALALALAVSVAFRRGLQAARALTASEVRAKHLAFHDQLTELPNRRLLIEHLALALAQASRRGGEVAVMLVDLDRFKFINDTYGHQAGDELLKEVARRLKAACRGEDVCARLGGDEFVILAPACGAAEAGALAQRVLTSLVLPVAATVATVHTAGSIGVAICADGATSADDLLRQADLALYRVKEHGRGAFCFFETEMDQAVQSRRGLEADLRVALARDEVTVVYQPQFEGDAMVAVEALARWNHPKRGPIEPSFFIPLAEECGLIGELGMAIVSAAFSDSARWPHLRVAINLSPVQLKDPNFLNSLQLRVETTGVNPERFEFELTESILLADDLQTQHTLAALRNLGFSLALDDFGTGYSSLSYLRKFPIDRIKIDRSFIASLPEDRVSESVVRAVVRLGRSLGLDVVAEGVETQEQRLKLRAAGCRSIQGYLTGRPVVADEIGVDLWLDDML